MNIFEFALFIPALVRSSVSTEESEDTDSHIYFLLDLKIVSKEESYGKFKKFLTEAKSLSSIADKTTTLLETLTISEVTTNFVNILRILKEDPMVVDEMLVLTKKFLNELMKAIVRPRFVLANNLKNDKWLLPENFELLTDLVNRTYEKIRSLQETILKLYRDEQNRIIKETGITEEKAKKLGENAALLQEGLFIMSKGVQENELKLYKETVFPPQA